MPNRYVVPRLGEDGSPVLVRQPNRGFSPLPAAGAWVPEDDYWIRRLRDEDVVEAEEPDPDPAPSPVEEVAVEAASDAEDPAPARKRK